MLHNGLDETTWSLQASVPLSLSLLLGNCLNAINKTSTGKRYPLCFALSYLLQHTLHSEYILFFKFLIQPTRNAHGDAKRSDLLWMHHRHVLFLHIPQLSIPELLAHTNGELLLEGHPRSWCHTIEPHSSAWWCWLLVMVKGIVQCFGIPTAVIWVLGRFPIFPIFHFVSFVLKYGGQQMLFNWSLNLNNILPDFSPNWLPLINYSRN